MYKDFTSQFFLYVMDGGNEQRVAEKFVSNPGYLHQKH
jgi:hypothetical protein